MTSKTTQKIVMKLLLTTSFLSAFNNTEKIEQYMQNHTDFSGAILVAEKENILFKKCYGCANYEFQIPFACDTKFPIASNTKTFTAVAILQLQEKELLTISDTLNTYIPGFSDEITIQHLLTHTSGIPNYYKRWDSIVHLTSLSQMIDTIKTWPLEFTPGSKYAYSNTGYLILAHIIEHITKKPFDAYMQDAIFTPLGMRHSGSLSIETMIPHKASGYQQKKGHICPAPSIVNPATLTGSGDLYACIDDMHRWTHNLFSGNVIHTESLDLLLKPYIQTGSSPERFYGLGCFIDTIAGKKCFEHGGGLVGYQSKVIHFLDEKITLIILSNIENDDLFFKICDELPQLIFKA